MNSVKKKCWRVSDLTFDVIPLITRMLSRRLKGLRDGITARHNPLKSHSFESETGTRISMDKVPAAISHFQEVIDSKIRELCSMLTMLNHKVDNLEYDNTLLKFNIPKLQLSVEKLEQENKRLREENEELLKMNNLKYR